MLRSAGSPDPSILPGNYTQGILPAASASPNKLAWVTDRQGCAGFMISNGTAWSSIERRVENFTGTTDASGNFSVVYSPPYASPPNVQPVTFPSADSVTRIRVTAADANGFTVHTETNTSVTVLGISVLSFGTSAVPNVPVRVVVVAV